VKTVVDFTLFRKRQVGELLVTTGWSYRKASDAAPTRQWCYVANVSNSDPLTYQIAVDGVPLTFDASTASRAGVTYQQVQQALPAV
jgi:hypothetical protein